MFEKYKTKKLEKKRRDVLSTIRGERLGFKEMAERAKRNGENPDPDFSAKAHENLAEIEQRATTEMDIDELDDLGEDAEQQGQLRAYICPSAEIRNTGILVFDLMAEWNLPKLKLDTVRALLEPQLDKTPAIGRSALRDIFEQEDSWRKYTSEYEDEMRSLTWWLFGATISLLVSAIIVLHFFPRWVPLGILAAGAAGSCVSVMGKMPLLEVSLSGELESYRRRVLSRVGLGVAGSVVGCGLLGWGLVSISIDGLTFGNVLNACSDSPATACTGLNSLVLVAVPAIFGFSERALKSLESKFLGSGGAGAHE